MKLTQKRVKELIEIMKKERRELYPEYVKMHIDNLDFIKQKDILMITKYNWLGGQLYAYNKILQIMQLKEN